MNTKTLKKKRETEDPGVKTSTRRTIDSRDLNEDEQKHVTNSSSAQNENGVESTNSNTLDDAESKLKRTVEEEEDDEQLRKQDEERGHEQV